MMKIRSLQAANGSIAALHGADLDVNEGQVVVPADPRGVAKASTVRAIVQEVIQVTGGIVEFDRVSVFGVPRYEIISRGIDFVPEDRRAFPSLAVAENLWVVRKGGSNGNWTPDPIYAMFPRLALARKRLVGFMSGGEQQMLSMGRMLLTNPRLLLLGESNEGRPLKIVDEIIAAILKIDTGARRHAGGQAVVANDPCVR